MHHRRSSYGIRDRIEAFEARSRLLSPASPMTSQASSSSSSSSASLCPQSPPTPSRTSRRSVDGQSSTRLVGSANGAGQDGSTPTRSGAAARTRQDASPSSIGSLRQASPASSNSTPSLVPGKAVIRGLLVPEQEGSPIDGLPLGQGQAYPHPLLKSAMLSNSHPIAQSPPDRDRLDSNDSDEETALLPTLDYEPSSLSSSSSARASTVVAESTSPEKVFEPSKTSAAAACLPNRPDVDCAHSPVPVSELFRPGALPLVIAHLDDYLDALPPVVFTPVPLGGGQPSQSRSKPSKAEREAEERRQEGMFPPLEQLEGGSGVHKYLWNRVGRRRVRFAWARPSVLADTIASLAVGIEVRGLARNGLVTTADLASDARLAGFRRRLFALQSRECVRGGPGCCAHPDVGR